MKIFAISDIHGNENIFKQLNNVDCDLIVICGDLGSKHFASLNRLSELQLKETKKNLDLIKKPFKFILGNDDWFDLKHINYLEQETVIQNELFIPFEYVNITPFNTNREVNENKLRYELSKISNNGIIVAHTPPYNYGDKVYSNEHVGSKSVREWILYNQPKIWLNGHIHEDFGVSNIKDTLIFNCSCNDKLQGWLIDTNTLDYNVYKLD